MIDSYTDYVFKQHVRLTGKHGAVLCVGDQRVCPSIGGTTAEYFKALGYAVHIDVDYNGGAAINADLNYAVLGLAGRTFDLVYDGGTAEHVCNVGQAFKTMADAVAPGGLIVQESPIVPYGQAYWGVSPLVQRDFFRAAGFTDVAHILHYRKSWKMDLLHAIVTRIPKRAADALANRARRVSGAKEFIFSHDRKHEYVYPREAWEDRHAFYPHPQTRSLYIGRKTKNVGEIVWPQMECYPSA